MSTAVHQISFRGLAGAIFVCLGLSLVLYIIGFATNEWSINAHASGDSVHDGLWQVCTCTTKGRSEDWFHAFQAMITLGLAGLLLSLLLATVYLSVHSFSKNCTIVMLIVLAFLTVGFMLAGFITYGANMDGLHWSFGISVVSSFFCLVAAFLSIKQMRNSGVRI